jgi:lipopolysaccharide/colanic/teichoic acid biosynthesis glycosyltransferase
LEERRHASAARERTKAESQNVLLVGVGPLAELYLRSIDEFAVHHLAVVGILASGGELPGRKLRSYQVLGSPEELLKIARELEIHGAPLDRVVVAKPRDRLASEALDTLLALERSSPVKVEWLHEALGFEIEVADATRDVQEKSASDLGLVHLPRLSIGRYRRAKRVFDFVGSTALIVLLTPVGAMIAALVAIDVGLPVVFWQKRPGRDGRPFKLYKFRSMRGAHDEEGNRLADEARSSRIGAWIRKTRLDELPQLYNILVGEMSFVGPRPLLPCDQPEGIASRLSVRPGLTGLAQAYGERTMQPADKNALDLWYIQNASLWLDIKIILRTAIVLLRGERLDNGMLRLARRATQQRDGRASVPLPAE